MDLRPLRDLDPSMEIETFNARLEELLNLPITHELPQAAPSHKKTAP